MNTATYYRQARGLGAFRAIDALAVARQAAELDRAAAVKNTAPFVDVFYEDGIRLSRGVRVY